MLLLPCVVSSFLGGRNKTLPLYATNFDSHCISFGSSGPAVWSHPIAASDLPTASSLWPGQACLGWCSSSSTHVHASSTHGGFGLGWYLKIKRIYLTFSANNHQSELYTLPLWGRQGLILRIFKLEGEKRSHFSLISCWGGCSLPWGRTEGSVLLSILVTWCSFLAAGSWNCYPKTAKLKDLPTKEHCCSNRQGFVPYGE